PSDNTKPSRLTSHGRLAPCGSSLRVDSARAEQKPARPILLTAISQPPASMASASPAAMRRAASPILCTPVVQADTAAIFGPCRFNWIEICPAAMLAMLLGMKNGDTFLGL